MLVLTRKENESFRIGDDIVVNVSRIDGNRVRFAIDAPQQVRVLRAEITGIERSQPDESLDHPATSGHTTPKEPSVQATESTPALMPSLNALQALRVLLTQA